MDTYIKTKIIQRHATSSEWIDSTYVPLKGELIIYDVDETHELPRVKIGDGVTPINDLPFTITQADLAENDPTSAAYIKNRTHWADDEEDIANVLYDNEFYFHPTNKIDLYASDIKSLRLIDGQRYFMYWGDKNYYQDHRYECIGKTVEIDNVTYTYIGNLYLFDKSLSHTGEPFVLAYSDLESKGFVCDEYYKGSITEYCAITTVVPTYHQISKEYLPDVIKETRVAERDIFPETLINFSETTIDGNGNGNAIMPRIALNPNAEYAVYWNGNKYTLRPFVNVGVAALGGFEYPFIYMCYSPSSPYFREGATTGVLVTTEGVESATIRICEFVNELQPKYLPKGYGGFAENITLLPETDLFFNSPLQGWQAAEALSEPMMVGYKYTVSINGAEYTGVANAYTMGGLSCVGFGNTAVVGGENTGEPFFALTMYGNGNYYFGVADLTGATAVRASLVKHDEEAVLFDKRLIGDWVARKEEQEIVIVPEMEATLSTTTMTAGFNEGEQGHCALSLDKTYNFTFKGVEYKGLKATEINDGTHLILQVATSDFNYNYFVSGHDTLDGMCSLASTSEDDKGAIVTFSIAEVALAPVKIPEEYLPENIQTRIDDALLEAKESGEFDGEDGKDGAPGKDGEPGKDGISATHSWNGTTLTITSASGTSSADLKGDPYTLTDEDKAAIVASVLESIGTPVFGYVDENNNVVVKGNLADGTYTVKYEMEDGSIIDIGGLVLDSNVYYSITKNLTNCTINNGADEVAEGESYSATITANSGYELKSVSVTMGGAAVTVTNGVINVAGVTGNIVITAVAEEIKASYTNLADPTSADWGTDKRLGSDGTFRDLSGNIVTNYIEVTRGDVIRVKGLNLVDSVNNSSNMGVYTTAKVAVSVAMPNTQTAYFSDISVTSEGGQLTYAPTAQSEKILVRFGGKPNNTANDIIITINEPID